MVLVQNKYNNTLVGVLMTQITFITHSSPSCYVTLRTQVTRLNSGNLGPQKTDSGVFIIKPRLHGTKIWIVIWITTWNCNLDRDPEDVTVYTGHSLFITTKCITLMFIV